jgi:uncharacterized membrane protein
LIGRRFLVAVQHGLTARSLARRVQPGLPSNAYPAATRGCDMIEVLASTADGSGTQLRLRPPRAMTARQFVMVFAALAGAMWLVAGLGWWTGNVFAPVFALLHTALVAGSLRVLWRSGEQEEAIRVGPAAVEVIPHPRAAPAFRAHPHWVRLQLENDATLKLVSSGRQVEIGRFLGPAERLQLADMLKGLLAAADGRHR